MAVPRVRGGIVFCSVCAAANGTDLSTVLSYPAASLAGGECRVFRPDE